MREECKVIREYLSILRHVKSWEEHANSSESLHPKECKVIITACKFIRVCVSILMHVKSSIWTPPFYYWDNPPWWCWLGHAPRFLKKWKKTNSHPKNLEEQKNFKVTSVEVTMGVSGYRAPNNIIIILYISIINKNNFLSKMSTLKCSDDFKLFSDDFTCLRMDTLWWLYVLLLWWLYMLLWWLYMP